MHHPKSGCRLLSVLAALYALRGAPAGAGDTFRSLPELRMAIEESTRLLGATASVPRYTLLTAILDPPRSRPRVPSDFRLEVTSLLEGFVDSIRGAGIPVTAVQDSSTKQPLGISASFKMHEDMPAFTFYARDSSPELFGAFYPVRRGVSWALVWPVQRLTVRVQGGGDSEFGNFAIAGVEWRHPARPLAVGIGVPMRLHNVTGEVGAIFQFRMKLD